MAAGRALLYSLRAAVKLWKARLYCSPLVADERSRRRESAHRQWETAEKLKSKSGYATIGDIIERYQSHAEDRPPTIRNNISALRMLVRTVRGGDPDLRSFEFSLAQIPHRLYGYVNYRY